MDYEEWARSAPGEITADALWKVEAYRLLLPMVPQQRGRALRDLPVAYGTDAGASQLALPASRDADGWQPDLSAGCGTDVSDSQPEPLLDDAILQTLLRDAPLP